MRLSRTSANLDPLPGLSAVNERPVHSPMLPRDEPWVPRGTSSRQMRISVGASRAIGYVNFALGKIQLFVDF